MTKIIIVGAGLFGSVAAELCSRAKHDVTVIDNRSPDAASEASACLLKPSWLSGIGKEGVLRGYEILQELYGVQQLDFKQLGVVSAVVKTTQIDWVNPAKILLKPDISAAVRQVEDGVVTLTTGEKLRGKVLVAAGVRTFDLLPPNSMDLSSGEGLPRMNALVGASIRFKGQLEEPMMRVYAPYKQAVAFNINKREVWFGDGTAVLQKNWHSHARVEAAVARAYDFFGLKFEDVSKFRVGSRPYVEGYKNGYFAQVMSKVWVSTGGAKNGTLLAALQAQRLLEEI